MTAPRELLDQLDQAYEASKLGGWPALEFRVMTAPDALPQLTAAVRAVLDLADDWDRTAAIFPDYGDLSAAAARSIRTAITEALA